MNSGRSPAEEAVRSCYSTWSASYFEEYYGEDAPYPPVHLDLIRQLLVEARARSVIDAGCGPASMLRELPPSMERFGFDLTPEMVHEARAVLAEQGVPEDHVWEGSVASAEAFRVPGREGVDAAVCIGVLPHVPAEQDDTVLENLLGSLKPGGIAVVEARNQLFALFTLNRYSHDLFMRELVPVEALREEAEVEEREALEGALRSFEGMFRTDQPPVRKGKADEPGYDEVLSRTHNPFELRAQMERAGFIDVRPLFYHYHALPPMFGASVPRLAKQVSLGLENPHDWRGHFLASAFLLVGRRR